MSVESIISGTESNVLSTPVDQSSLKNPNYGIANFLGAKRDKVNEEELFAAVISSRLKTIKSDPVAQKFQDALQKHLSEAGQNKRKLGYEDASYLALDDLVKDKTITKNITNTVKNLWSILAYNSKI